MSNAPWDRKPWLTNTIEDENRYAGCFLSGFALFWNGFTWPMAIGVLSQDRSGFRFLVLIFPLVGILVAAAAVHAILRRRRFGSAVFELATRPGAIGRAIAGELRVPRGLDAERDINLTLKCVRTVVTGSGKNRSSRDTTLWEASKALPGGISSGGMLRIPVAFAIPPEAEETDESNSRNMIRWYLEVSAQMEGVDFGAKFQLPVFRTEESATPLTEEERRRLS